MSITPEPVIHPVPAYAMRIDGPSELPSREQAVLSYSGDSAPCEGLRVVARGADAFLCEASFLDGEDAPTGTHLTAADAGRLAQSANCDRLIVTHVPPWTDPNAAMVEARAHFEGALDVARPGMHLVV